MIHGTQSRTVCPNLDCRQKLVRTVEPPSPWTLAY